MDIRVQNQILREVGKLSRKTRSPQHPFYVQHRPYQLQPFFITPVLPGETMKNLNCVGRVITDPLATGMGNILPWWHEQYYFYVKLRDLSIRDDIENMLMQGTALGITDAAKDETFHAGTGVDWVYRCLERITEEYFRDEGETTAPLLGNLPLAAAIRHKTNWADNISVDTGAEPTVNELLTPEGDRDPTAAMAEAYNRMRAMSMVDDMSFNDWLAMWGVNVPGEGDERNKPELLRFVSNWSYPTNVVEPTTGVPSAAVAWSVNERADKDRFFTEAGFVIGVTVVRAKVYMGNQRQTVSSFLDNPYAWLNPMHRDRPESALEKFVGPTSPNGPLSGQTNDYYVDLRDLFIYGEQFVAGESGGYVPALPTAAGDKRFMTSAMIDALFASAAANKVRQDGVVSINILGHPTTGTDAT